MDFKMVLKSNFSKHVFLSSTNPHILNLLLNLIQKKVIEREETLLVLEDKTSYTKDLIQNCISHCIEVVQWNELKNITYNFITLNSLSLQPNTAEIIIDCLNANYITTDRINILITDDEIDRWLKLYNIEGKLKVNKTALIDENVLKVLEQVDNYIAPYSTWGKPLENILNRKLNVIDAVLPFSVLDYKSQEQLEIFLNDRRKYKASNQYRILLFTRDQNLKKVFGIVTSYLSKYKEITTNKDITLGIWLPLSRKGTIFYTLIKSMIKLKKIPITLRLEQPVSSEQYALMLYEYDCLILQERGGFSTAKYFAENIGKLITLKDSFNDKTLNFDYGIKTFNNKTYLDALKNATTSSQKNEEEDINHFANMVSKRHDESFIILRNYWNSFK